MTGREDLIADRHRTVVFDETGEERDVIGYCKTCRVDPDTWPPAIVSPQGVAHHAEYEYTLCGKPATGENWWWSL